MYGTHKAEWAIFCSSINWSVIFRWPVGDFLDPRKWNTRFYVCLCVSICYSVSTSAHHCNESQFIFMFQLIIWIKREQKVGLVSELRKKVQNRRNLNLKKLRQRKIEFVFDWFLIYGLWFHKRKRRFKNVASMISSFTAGMDACMHTNKKYIETDVFIRGASLIKPIKTSLELLKFDCFVRFLLLNCVVISFLVPICY